MSSGHASEDDFASAESEAEDSGEGGSLDEQVVERAGVGCDEGVGFDEGEGPDTDRDGASGEPQDRGKNGAMQGNAPLPPVLAHAEAKKNGDVEQQKEVIAQKDGPERDESGLTKKDADEERLAKELHGKEDAEVKQEASQELQHSSTASKDEQHGTASSGQLQDDLPEQEMDRRVEVMKRLEGAAAGGNQQGGGWGWGWGQSIWSSVSSVASTQKLGQLGQGITSMIHQVEEGLGLTDSGAPASQDSSTGEGEKEGPGKDGDSTKPGGGETESSVVTEEPHHGDERPVAEVPQKAFSAADGTEGSFWSGLDWGVESIAEASKGLVSTGMDALESVGRKTMDILSEGDPRLKRKREMFVKEHPTLSQMLREAKEKAESVARYKLEEEGEVSLSLFLDEYQGLAHLEALELLSKECATKVNLLKQPSSEDSGSSELEEQLSALGELFESDLDSAEEPVFQGDTIQDIQQLFKGFSLPVRVDKLVRAVRQWRDKAVKDREQAATEGGAAEVKPEKESETGTRPESGSGDKQQTESGNDGAKVKSEAVVDVGEVFEHGVRCLAEVVSCTIDVFRKTGELSLIPEMKEVSSTEVGEKAKSLSCLVKHELSSLVDAFGKAIQSKKSPEAQALVTSLFLETSHSCSHVQDAFQLLLPVMELRVITNHQPTT